MTFSLEVAQHPWPDSVHVQGGTRDPEAAYHPDVHPTAFVEAFPPGAFLRAEAATVTAAETACWAKYQRMTECPTHPEHGPFEPGHPHTGSGFCTRCGTWFARIPATSVDVPGDRHNPIDSVPSYPAPRARSAAPRER